MEEKSHHKKNHKWIFLLIGLILLIVAIVLILIYFMRGTTTSEDDGAEVTSVQSLSCEGTKTEYPFVTKGEISGHSLKINATFKNDALKKINTIKTVTPRNDRLGDKRKTISYILTKMKE